MLRWYLIIIGMIVTQPNVVIYMNLKYFKNINFLENSSFGTLFICITPAFGSHIILLSTLNPQLNLVPVWISLF